MFPDGAVWGDAVMGEDEVPSPRVNSTLALDGDGVEMVGGREVKVRSHDGEDEVEGEETAWNDGEIELDEGERTAK